VKRHREVVESVPHGSGGVSRMCQECIAILREGSVGLPFFGGGSMFISLCGIWGSALAVALLLKRSVDRVCTAFLFLFSRPRSASAFACTFGISMYVKLPFASLDPPLQPDSTFNPSAATKEKVERSRRPETYTATTYCCALQTKAMTTTT
jgi:hypothetical protein